MNERRYYSLRFLGSNAYHSKNDVLRTTNKVLNIGETADCEIRFESGQYEPERYATIVENEDGESWRLIQRSEHVRAQIAGMGGFGYVHQLHDGDVITFDGQKVELEFHTHFDSNYGKAGILIEQHTNKWMLYGILATCVAVLFIMSLVFYNQRSKDIEYEDLNDFLSSIFIIRVDSVQWIEVIGNDTTLVQPTLTMDGGGTAGTAFLTTDGKLITARHCIEYWIGEDFDLTTNVKSLKDNDVRKWAILTEKFAQEKESQDTIQLLRVYFSICGDQLPDDPVYRFTSIDKNVHFSSKDTILQIADFNEDYYWRTVRPYFSNQEMELGDIVYIDVDSKGNIELADSATISQLNQSSSIAVLGYPNNASGKKTTFESGKIKENRSDTLRRVSPNLIFDANITHGFSGGPVFVRANDKIVVVGVVSKIDTDNGIYKKAVPVSEINYMIKREKEGIEND